MGIGAFLGRGVLGGGNFFRGRSFFCLRVVLEMRYTDRKIRQRMASDRAVGGVCVSNTYNLIHTP